MTDLVERFRTLARAARDHGAQYASVTREEADEAAAEIERLREESEVMRKIAEGLSAAISWLDYPFIDNRTAEPELRSRVGFMMKDAEPLRAALSKASGEGV